MPAVVLAILNVASIDLSPFIVIDNVLPILRVRSCSKFKKTSFGAIEPFAKITLPVLAFAASPNARIRPLIVLDSESAAVICIGVVSFIVPYPLFSLFHQRSSRQCDCKFHTLARALMMNRANTCLSHNAPPVMMGKNRALINAAQSHS